MKPTYREIAETLRAAIRSGAHAPGDTLPSESVLASQFGVSRSLVNKALQLLTAEGLVRPRQGDGTRVTWLPPLSRSGARYQRNVREQGGAKGAFDAEIRALGLEPQHEITVTRITAPANIADQLGETGAEVVCRSRRLLASGIPVSLVTSYIPAVIAAGTAFEEPAPAIVGGVKSLYATLGYPQVEAHERISVRLPTDEEAGKLEISTERSVFDILHVGCTADGRAVEVTTTVTPTNYLIIESTFPLA
ncbi:GntR family transcriptional regulator [Streptosporangium algeriense]|uniref:GntR family transcriptional regulator n=1 Tax=Streptosporangium algeriense TaxID=1682748 RepID=A0ABW3E3P6_9ACTN